MEERLRRGANSILNSHYERRKLERDAGLPETRSPLIDAILDTARDTGLGVTQSKPKSPRWVGQHPPRDATSLCKLFMQDSSTPDTLGAVTYRYLSATVHGSLHGLLRSSQPVAGMPVGKMGLLRSQEVDRSEAVMLAAGVLVGYITAAERQMAYFGWTGGAWDSWRLAVWKRVRPYMPDSPS